MTSADQHVLLPTFPLEYHHDLGSFLHLGALLARAHRHVVVRQLARHAPDSVLPDRATTLRTIQGEAHRRVLAEVDDALVLLETWKGDAHVTVSATDERHAAAVADEVKARMPVRLDDRRCEVTFADATAGSRTLTIDVRPWQEVRECYPGDVRRALDALGDHNADRTTSRRLILWHGVPGTGKTTAVRALMHTWRDWADAVVIPDPEELLKDGRYLRRVLLDADDEDRWKLYVLEDAEALLRKETGGSAMGKLLNLTDGLLGQGLRCLFLVTTNEPLGAIHPAVVRPGRCLAHVEFQPLAAAQAANLLGYAVDRPMTLAEVMTAAPVGRPAEPLAIGQYL